MNRFSQDARARCIIVGAGGHGRVVLDILMKSRAHEVVGFLDSNPATHGRRMDGIPILGDLGRLPELARSQGITGVIVAIGDNGIRRAFADEVEGMGFALINALHPSANLAHNVTVGKNVVVAAGVLVSTHCQIGDSAILNTGCIIDHESMIGTAAHICPGARLAGRVTVESGAFIGIGATVIQGLRIGCESVIGAGAVVIRDVEPMSTVVGVPAHVVHEAPGHSDAEPWSGFETVPARPDRKSAVAAT
jgi:sugar O-acyltransferase (sialic acid O-acetyltransferase NeuD family)